MQNETQKKECGGGSCDKSKDKECAGGVCDKKDTADLKPNVGTDTTKDLKQGEKIPQSNTLGQDMGGIAIGLPQNQTSAGEKHLPTNVEGKPGTDAEKSAPAKFNH